MPVVSALDARCASRALSQIYMGIVAITGASGFIGARLTQLLARQPGFEVRALIRRGNPPQVADDGRLAIIRGDVADVSVLAQLLIPGCAVANFAYDAEASAQANLAYANALAEACLKYKVKRLVHCSTAVVAGRTCTNRVDETTECRPRTSYERTRLAIEHLLCEKARGKFELAILRPTAVFGPGGRNLLKLAHDLTRGRRLANFLRSCVNDRRRMNLVAVDNVTAAAAFLLETEKHIDQEAFIISDDDAPDNNFRDVEAYLMQALGITGYTEPRVVLPAGALSLLLRLRGRSLLDPGTVFACNKLRDLGFSKPVAFAAGLISFAKWYKDTFVISTETDRCAC